MLNNSNLIFDEEKHQYSLDGKILISVTQLLQKHKLTPSYDAVDKELLREASERGTLIHEEVENWVREGDIGFTVEAEQICDYLMIETGNRRADVWSEQTVYNDVVAGRFDLLYKKKIGDKEVRTIADIKTGSTKHLFGWAWQLSLYSYLYQKMTGNKVDNLVVLWCHDGEIEAIYIDYVGDEKIEHLFDCERKGELLFDDSLDFSEEQFAELRNCLDMKEYYEEKVKEYEEKAKELKNTLVVNMGARGVKTVDRNNMKITYVAPIKKNSFDTDTFKKEKPDLYKQYIKVSETKASLRITLKENKDNE